MFFTTLFALPNVWGSSPDLTLFFFSMYEIENLFPRKIELSDFHLSACLVGSVAQSGSFLVLSVFFIAHASVFDVFL